MGEVSPAPGSRVRLSWKVRSIEKDDAGVYVATFDTPSGIQMVRARSVVSTAPAHSLKDVLSPIMPDASSIFEKIRDNIHREGIYHPPVYAVTVAYPSRVPYKCVALAWRTRCQELLQREHK